MRWLEEFCMHTQSSVDSFEKKIFLAKIQNKDKLRIIYNNELLEIVESFKYLGLEALLKYRWNECSTHHLDAGKRAYYTLESICNDNDIKC